MDGIRPVALIIESIFDRVCLKLVFEAKSSFVITTARGRSSFRHNSKCALPRSTPKPAVEVS